MTMQNMLPSVDALAKCQNLETWHSAHPYGHQDAMRRLTDRDSKAIAAILGISGRTVRSWRDLDEEHRGPAEVLELAIVAALRMGRPVGDAVAPLAALAEAFGFRLVDASSAAGLAPQVTAADLTRAAGVALHQALEAAADGQIEQSELPGVLAALDSLHSAADRFRAECISSAKGCADRTKEAARVPLKAIR